MHSPPRGYFTRVTTTEEHPTKMGVRSGLFLEYPVTLNPGDPITTPLGASQARTRNSASYLRNPPSKIIQTVTKEGTLNHTPSLAFPDSFHVGCLFFNSSVPGREQAINTVAPCVLRTSYLILWWPRVRVTIPLQQVTIILLYAIPFSGYQPRIGRHPLHS